VGSERCIRDNYNGRRESRKEGGGRVCKGIKGRGGGGGGEGGKDGRLIR